MTKEALTQLREVHAIQGRDGCWDIDDYMLGLYNGLELALSIVENRACKYKQRPKSQPEQEPMAVKHMMRWVDNLKWQSDNGQHMNIPSGLSSGTCWELAIELEQFIKSTPPQRTWVGLTAKEKHEFRYSHMTTADFIEDIEAKLKDKNT